jgi:hypothetical protein
MTYWMEKEGLISKEALKAAASGHKYSDSLLGTIAKMEEALLDGV